MYDEPFGVVGMTGASRNDNANNLKFDTQESDKSKMKRTYQVKKRKQQQ